MTFVTDYEISFDEKSVLVVGSTHTATGNIKEINGEPVISEISFDKNLREKPGFLVLPQKYRSAYRVKKIKETFNDYIVALYGSIVRV